MHVLDCGPLNHGSVIACWLPQFLVDFGFCDVAFILFYQSKHGKVLVYVVCVAMSIGTCCGLPM